MRSSSTPIPNCAYYFQRVGEQPVRQFGWPPPCASDRETLVAPVWKYTQSSSGGSSSSIYLISDMRISVVSLPLSTSLMKCASTCI